MTPDAFPYLKNHPEITYLDSAATTHKHGDVLEAMRTFDEGEYATVNRGIYASSLKASEKVAEVREQVANFLGVSCDEVIFTKGTTESINLVAASFGRVALDEGDEVIVSEMEHHANLVPWQMICKERGATLRVIPLTDEGELDYAAYFSMLSPKTKIVAVTHASNVLGTINDLEQIGQAAHAVGAVVMVDGAQAAPHRLDVKPLYIDFYAFSGHKMYGPTGIGVLWGRREHLERMVPYQGGGDMIERVELTHTTYQSGYQKFEAGTPPITQIIGLGSALALQIKEGDLTTVAMDRLARMEGVRILGPEKRVPLITLTVDGVHPLDLATMLDAKGICVRSGHLCAQPCLRRYGLEHALRLSFGAYNTMDDLERFFKAFSEALDFLQATPLLQP